MNIFVILESGVLKKSSLHDDKLVLWKKLLQVPSEDFVILEFDWWDLASELNYEKKIQTNFITLVN